MTDNIIKLRTDFVIKENEISDAEKKLLEVENFILKIEEEKPKIEEEKSRLGTCLVEFRDRDLHLMTQEQVMNFRKLEFEFEKLGFEIERLQDQLERLQIRREYTLALLLIKRILSPKSYVDYCNRLKASIG